ncbi:MAG: AAA family ATPase [Candidatus Sulfobium sp.]|jgi:pilus assembly protein CpaE
MAQNISVVIIESDSESSDRIMKQISALGDHVAVEGVANSFETGFELIHRKKPMVVILDICDGKGGADIERISRILTRFSQTTIFAVCDDKSSDTILRAMRAGAAEYLLKPVSDSDLASALQKLGRLWIVKPSPEQETGKIFSIFSPKGGVGVTTIAINLATNIHQITHRPTVLVDLDLDAGDVTTFLNLKPSYTISDVTLNISRLDKSFLRGVITRHESGIYVLAEPQKVEEGVSVSGVDLRKVLGLLKTMFSYIIVDTQTVLDERTLAAIEMSDMILLTFILSLPGIKNIQRYLNYFDKTISRNKLKLVVNRYLKRGDIRLEDAEKVLHFPIGWSLPNNYDDAITCLNKGMPISMGAPRSQLNSAFQDLARNMVGKK